MFDKQEHKTQNEVRDVDRDINSLRILIQQLFAALSDEIKQTKGEIMAAIDDLNAAVKTLIADTSTALADISTKLTALAGNQADPALAAQIETVVGQINTLDATIKAADPGAAVPVAPAPPAV